MSKVFSYVRVGTPDQLGADVQEAKTKEAAPQVSEIMEETRTDAGNEPTRCEKISKSALLRLLPAGTAITLVHTDFRGPCRKHRTVLKATSHHLVLKQDDNPDAIGPSYLTFSTGDTFHLHENGFTVQEADGHRISYVFGHV